jgi:beta-catenin-like protein 1
MRYAKDPLKFLDSETELMQAIQEVFALDPTTLQNSTGTQLYYETIISLLDHENIDISILVLEMLEQNEELNVDLLLQLNFLDLLILNLNRLENREQYFTILSILETLLSAKPDLDSIVFDKVHEFLVANLTVKYDSVKQYCTEILVILLQTNVENRLKMKPYLEVLLQSLAYYKSRDPEEKLEIETMENVFDALCSLLLEGELCQAFIDEEGIELMILMLKSKKMSRMRSLKVLSHAMEYPATSAVFIELFGLKYLFPLLGKSKYKAKYSDFSQKEHDGDGG